MSNDQKSAITRADKPEQIRQALDNSVEIYEAFAGDQLEEDERRIKGVHCE